MRGVLVAQAGEFNWLDHGGGYVLYHRLSGKTHFVNPATHMLLTHVFATPADRATAARALADQEGAAADAAFVDQVAGLVDRLEEMGLLRRC